MSHYSTKAARHIAAERGAFQASLEPSLNPRPRRAQQAARGQLEARVRTANPDAPAAWIRGCERVYGQARPVPSLRLIDATPASRCTVSCR